MARHGELVSGQAEIQRRRLGSWGFGNLVRRGFDLGGPGDQSLRRRGQHLVVAGALLRALIGAALGLIVEDGQTSRAVAVPGRARGAVLAVSPPSSHPPASRAVGSGNRTAGNDSSGERRVESPDRPDKRDGKAHKDREGGQDKPGGHGKDKPRKGKDN